MSPSAQVAAGRVVHQLSAGASRRSAGLRTGTIDVNGLPVTFDESDGRVAGVPVVMVHGFSGDRGLWSRLAGHLRRYRLIVPDLIGHGTTPFVSGADYSAPGQAEFLIAFLDALRVERFHLIGNSMGGFISATVTRTAPSRVASLSLICAAGVTAPNPSAVDQMRARGDNPFLMDSPEDFDAFFPLTMAKPPLVPGFVKASIAADYVRRRDQLAEIHAGYFHQNLLDDHLSEITVPTLILWGERDRIIDVSSAWVWKDGIPNSELVLYDDLGHMPMLEDPARVAGDLRPFIESANQ